MADDGTLHRVRRGLVTPEDARVWRAVVKDVAPLPGRSVDAALPSEPPAAPPPPPDRPSAPPRAADPLAAPAGRQQALPAMRPGLSAGVDKRTAQRLTRGEMAIDGRLDLHGLTQDAAHAQLIGFVLRAHESGRRCLLVITGKGRDGGGVLRAQVPRWLNQSPLRERLVGFSCARPQHGGDGALYLLVKRRRPAEG
ncbi:MAG: Smr/MutS family protein [Magnetospirillum sp.]|nr:Smr/MutS family protein [Magnetospirillum sp.]